MVFMAWALLFCVLQDALIFSASEAVPSWLLAHPLNFFYPNNCASGRRRGPSCGPSWGQTRSSPAVSVRGPYGICTEGPYRRTCGVTVGVWQALGGSKSYGEGFPPVQRGRGRIVGRSSKGEPEGVLLTSDKSAKGDTKEIQCSSVRGTSPMQASSSFSPPRHKSKGFLRVGSSRRSGAASVLQPQMKQVQQAVQPEQQTQERDIGDTAYLLKRLMEALGYWELLGGQEETLRRSAEGQDLVLCSPTGSGKSLSLLLPLLQWHTARSAAAPNTGGTKAAEAGAAGATKRERLTLEVDISNSNASNSSTIGGSSSSRSQPHVTDWELLPMLANGGSAKAAYAVCTAEAVSLVVVPTATLGLQLLGELAEAARRWLPVATEFRDRKTDKRRQPSAPLRVPQLLLIDDTLPQQQQQQQLLLRDSLQEAAAAATRTTTHKAVRKETQESLCWPSLRDLQRVTDPTGLILFATPQTLKSFLTRLLTLGPPGALRRFASCVRHFVLDEIDRMLQPLRRYAPLKERMQRLKQPQTVEVLLRLLVQSRCSTTAISGEKPDNPWAHFVETRPQDLHRASTVSASRHPLPLQLLAASASLGRPLHRYLANLTRWKQQQLLLRQARDPPLEDFLSKRRNNELQPMRFNRGLSLSGTFATPQQRMKAALERLADRGLLGLPRTLTALGKPAEGASVGLGMHSLPNPFKAILPIIRSTNEHLVSPTTLARVCSSEAPVESPLSAGTPGLATTQSLRPWQIIPTCLSHALFPVPDNSAETLADAAADLCSQLKPRKALLLLQEGSSLRTLQMFMKARGHKVELLHQTGGWWRNPRLQQQDNGQFHQPQQLIATTMEAARGLHVAGAEVLLLLGRVKNVREYIHLAGRVGRCGQQGLSVAVSDAATQRILMSWQKTLGITFGSLQLSHTSSPPKNAVTEEEAPINNPTPTAQHQHQWQQSLAVPSRPETACNSEEGAGRAQGGEVQLDRGQLDDPYSQLPSLLLN